MLHHSYRVAKITFKCDLCGISIAIYNGAFTGVYLAFSGVHSTFRIIYLAIVFVVLLIGLASPFLKSFDPYRVKFWFISSLAISMIFLHWSFLASDAQIH
jgi:hypothetical protein